MLNLAIERAASFLASRQDADGYWRDYQLEPGRSEAWTTACVGLALVRLKRHSREAEKAAIVLLASRRPGGWGYNSRTACDADTTSWVVRFLASVDALDDCDPASLLEPYLLPNGGVRTFSSQERFGSWGLAHDEVAPIAGLALLCSGELGLAERIRRGVLQSKGWRRFWWRCDSYVSAQNLEFLSLSGGIPQAVREREAATLERLGPAGSSFDLAQRLTALSCLGRDALWSLLLGEQQADGSWPSSPELLVPDQKDGFAGQPEADDRRLMSTALSILALVKRFPRRERQSISGNERTKADMAESGGSNS